MLKTFLFLMFVAVGSAAAAQPSDTRSQDDATPRGRAARGAEGGLSPVEVVNMLDAYALVQAQTALELNDGQYGQFVPRLRRLHQVRRQTQQERNRLVQQLRRLTAPQVTAIDEAAVRTALKSLRDLDERSAAEIRKASDAVDELLDVRQQARFRVFEEMLERRKLDLLMRARQGAAAPRR